MYDNPAYRLPWPYQPLVPFSRTLNGPGQAAMEPPQQQSQAQQQMPPLGTGIGAGGGFGANSNPQPSTGAGYHPEAPLASIGEGLQNFAYNSRLKEARANGSNRVTPGGWDGLHKMFGGGSASNAPSAPAGGGFKPPLGF